MRGIRFLEGKMSERIRLLPKIILLGGRIWVDSIYLSMYNIDSKKDSSG